MFDSITFHSNPYYHVSKDTIVPHLFISVNILCEFAMLPDVFFLREQMYTSGSTFVKKIKLLVCLGNTHKNKTARQTALSLVLVVKTFDSY